MACGGSGLEASSVSCLRIAGRVLLPRRMSPEMGCAPQWTLQKQLLGRPFSPLFPVLSPCRIRAEHSGALIEHSPRLTLWGVFTAFWVRGAVCRPSCSCCKCGRILMMQGCLTCVPVKAGHLTLMSSSKSTACVLLQGYSIIPQIFIED